MINGDHQVARNYPTKSGRRHSAWYNNFTSSDPGNSTAWIDSWSDTSTNYLIQRGIIDKSVADPERNFKYQDEGEEVNFGGYRMYTSYLASHGFISDGDRTPLTAPEYRWTPGHYFEIRVNFSKMNMGGHRHSFWMMPAEYDSQGKVIGGNVAYDDNPTNGVEIDIYEYEAAPVEVKNRLYMKVLGNPTDEAGTGNSKNTLSASMRPVGIEYSGGEPTKPEEGGKDTEVTTTSSFPGGLISQGWHTIGLYWGTDRLVWYVDGYPVVEDRVLVPQVPHYLLVTREMNSGRKSEEFNVPQVQNDPGIFGENVGLLRNRLKLGRVNTDGTYDTGLTNRDHVMVDYVKVWQVQTGGASSGSGPGEPTNVSGFRYSNTDGQIFWSAPSSTGSGIDYYSIYKNGVFVENVTGTNWYTNTLTGTGTLGVLII